MQMGYAFVLALTILLCDVVQAQQGGQDTCNDAEDPSLCQHLDARRSCSHILVKQVCPVKCGSCLDVTPEPPAVQKCFEQCVDDGYADCIETPTLFHGSNQQFHCDHACLIRDHKTWSRTSRAKACRCARHTRAVLCDRADAILHIGCASTSSIAVALMRSASICCCFFFLFLLFSFSAVRTLPK